MHSSLVRGARNSKQSAQAEEACALLRISAKMREARAGAEGVGESGSPQKLELPLTQSQRARAAAELDSLRAVYIPNRHRLRDQNVTSF